MNGAVARYGEGGALAGADRDIIADDVPVAAPGDVRMTCRVNRQCRLRISRLVDPFERRAGAFPEPDRSRRIQRPGPAGEGDCRLFAVQAELLARALSIVDAHRGPVVLVPADRDAVALAGDARPSTGAEHNGAFDEMPDLV